MVSQKPKYYKSFERNTHWRKLSTAKTTSTAFHLNNRDSQRQLAVSVNGTMLPNCEHPVYLGVTLDRTLTYKHHIEALRRKVNVRNGLLRCLAGSTWGAYTSTLRTGALALVYSAAEYASPVWSRSAHTGKLDVGLYDSMRIIREFSIWRERRHVTPCLSSAPSFTYRLMAIIKTKQQQQQQQQHWLL